MERGRKMTTITKTAPFRADHVGSLLRPASLHEAIAKYRKGNLPYDELKEIQRSEVKRIVDKQIEVGLTAVTDGEFQRLWWHTDFMEYINGVEGYVPEQGYQFANQVTDAYNVRLTGKVSWNENHPFIEDAKFLIKQIDGRAVPKFTIPSPNQFFNTGIIGEEYYASWDEFAEDIIKVYQDAVKAFYDVGIRYLQFDDVYIAGLSSPNLPFAESDQDRQSLIDLALKVVNGVLEVKPEDMQITTHLCRGNYRSDWAFSGSYDLIAPTLFAKEKVDGFFLEYDDERSGDFQALKHIPRNGAKVVIGVFTSKNGELEDKEEIKRRIQEASEFVPLDQICLSPQCGFASTHHGNELSEEQQWNKLKYIVDISKEIWG